MAAILGRNGGAVMRCHHLGRPHVLLKESNHRRAKILALGWDQAASSRAAIRSAWWASLAASASRAYVA